MDTENTPDVATAAEPAPTTWCPSGQALAPEAVVLGVRSQSDGTLAYLATPAPAREVLPMIPEGIEPTRVLRFASHCVSSCAHRLNNDCTLIDKVRTLPAADEQPLPRCHLRARCQWWQQTGRAACGRCPAVSTSVHASDALNSLIADPTVTPDQLQEWIENSPEGPAERAAG
ncbi:hypothetical protein [Streptomyces sp. NPDC058595]|uniref:hypothetical protein n=1 Tax=Streptomyces sp. NPDC058595 TaxID=3346550 RepID=UPI00365919C2